MKVRLTRHDYGFTMAETLIGLGILTAVGVACYSMLLSSTLLFAKNVSVNTSGTVLRTALDRMYIDLNQAYGVPKLINADGSLVASGSPAAGFTFEQYLGGPYVVTNPSGTGLPASTQSFSMKFYAGDAVTAQPLPTVNDVVVLDNGLTRPVVSSCTANPNPVPTPPNTTTVNLTVNLKAALGNAISWKDDGTPTGTKKTAFLIHKKAYVVATTTNGYAELRYYNNAESVTDYSNQSNYLVLSRELSSGSSPFSLVTKNGNQFLKIALRMQDQKSNNTLVGRYAKNDFNTFMRLDTMLRPRN